MARSARPWFYAEKNTWYIWQDGKKVSLGVQGEGNKAEAVKAWHNLMANGKPTPELKVEGPTVAEVITAFLADVADRAKPNTLRVYRYFLEPVATRYSKMKACDLTPTAAEVYARKPEWSPSSRNAFLGALATAFKWAVKARLIVQTPLAGMTLPPKESRGADTLVTPEDHIKLVQATTPAFALFLRVLYATGARPGEVASITAENFDEANALVWLKEHKTAHKGKRRVIYLSPEAVTILREQKANHPTGTLLRNTRGDPWTEKALVKAMIATRQRAGIPHAIAYGLRHTFATTALANGVPDALVAELLGHSGTAMLHRHYSHLTAQSQALREALNRVRQ
jgi:integrase